jgi:DNA repair exonuclease SbcCD ATPase subunit
MADNQKTYKATVDVETKDAAKNIDLLNKSVSTSLGEFDNLNEAISKTQDTLGKIDPKSAEFKELSKELADLKDNLRDTEAQSLRFTEALAQQPGVVGLVGQSLEGLRGTFKLFMANPIIAVVAGIAGAFLALRESLTKTSEGQETLNRISAAFGKILGPVFAVIEKVALPIFEKFADLLDLVAKGFNRFARFLGIEQEKIDEASRNSSEVLQEAYEEEVERQEEQTKVQEDESQKRIEQQKKEAEERLRIQQEADKILLEAQLSLLSDRDRELQEREMRYQEELKALKAAGVTDLTAFEEEYRMDTLEINKKYDDEILKQQEEQNQKKLDAQKEADEKALKQKEEFDQFMIDSEQFKTDALGFIQDQQVANVASVGNILGMIAGKNKKLAIAGLVLEQGANIAKVVIDTARGISAATAAAAPFIANPITAIPATANLARVIAQQKIAAGISIAGIIAGAAQGISQINQADIPGSGGSAPSGGGGANIPTPQISSTAAPEFVTGGQADTGTQVAGAIAGAQQQPIRAYVVSTEVSSTQALDRRVNNAATFG